MLQKTFELLRFLSLSSRLQALHYYSKGPPNPLKKWCSLSRKLTRPRRSSTSSTFGFQSCHLGFKSNNYFILFFQLIFRPSQCGLEIFHFFEPFQIKLKKWKGSISFYIGMNLSGQKTKRCLIQRIMDRWTRLRDKKTPQITNLIRPRLTPTINARVIVCHNVHE